MTISEAIKKAIDNGYNQTKYQWTPWITGQIFMQKEFWQCLGKAMGWKQGGKIGGKFMFKGSGAWLKWHDMVDHLSDGGTPESFFKELK